MYIFKLLKLTKPYFWWMLLGLLLAFLTIGSGIGLMMTAAYLLAFAALKPPIYELQIAITLVRFFGTFRGVFRYLERLVTHNVTFKLLKQYRVWFYEKIEPIAPAGLIKYNTGDMLRRIVGDVESLENLYIRIMLPPLTAIFISFLIYGVLHVFDFKIAFLTMAALYFSGLLIPAVSLFLTKKMGEEMTDINSKLTVLSIDLVQGMSDLFVFNGIRSHFEEIKSNNRQLCRIQKKMSMINSINVSALGLIMNLTVAIAIILMNGLITSGNFDGLFSSMIILGIMASFESVTPLPFAFQQLGSTSRAASRVFEIIEKKPQIEIVRPINRLILSEKNASLSFEKVSFSYSGDSGFSLNDITINFQKGVNAVVGASGSGKTSLINLIFKFWEYKSGNIKLNEVELKNCSHEDIANYISVCPQNVYFFNLSVRENLLLANEDASDDEIIKVLKMAEIFEIVNELNNGLNSFVGEQGLKLSGGEIRRLGIARTILADSPIMIFDEPTADLDSKTAEKIMSNILALSKDKIIIIITHIISDIFREFNQIIVMSDGNCLEKGKHLELINNNSIYKKLFAMQNCDGLLLKQS